MWRRILAPMDGTELSDRTLLQIRRLALRQDLQVRLVFVRPPLKPGQPPALADALSRSASRYLEGVRRMLGRQGVRADCRILEGEPVKELLAAAEDYRPSAIAISTGARKGAARLLAGSVTEQLLRRSPCPLLALNPSVPRGKRRPASFRRILVPLDGSQASARILPLARDFARRYGAEVLLLHVVEPPLNLPEYHLTAALPSTTDRARQVLEPHRRSFRGIPFETQAVLGDAARCILAAAQRERADLIAMTTHGRTGLLRMALGSVAERVLMDSPCPVLLQRISKASRHAP